MATENDTGGVVVEFDLARGRMGAPKGQFTPAEVARLRLMLERFEAILGTCPLAKQIIEGST